MERRPRAFYRRCRGEETAGESIELKRGVTAGSGLVTGGIFVRRKKEVSVLTRGSHQSAGERGGEVPVRDFWLAGRGPFRVLGRFGSLGLLLFLFLLFSFLFCFLYFFIDFAF
jgi:hypothetical protein